jgi:hypothetical protein
MFTYKEITQESLGESFTCIARTDEDGNTVFIPIEPANSDYQAYLKSLDETSTL